MKEEELSRFIVVHISLLELTYKTNLENKDNIIAPHVDIRYEYRVDEPSEKNSKGTISTRTHIDVFKSKKESPFALSFTFLADFLSSEGTDRDVLEEFATQEAPTIIFPYARELVSHITSRSICPTLILPPFKLQGRKQKEKKEKH